MSNILEIKKRANEEIACWKVDASSVTPNTVIAPDTGIMVVIKLNGVSRLKSGNPGTVNGIFNPGKEKKLIGGNKPYENIEIYAIDQTTDFAAEWGLGGPNALPCHDPDFDVDCKAVAFGKYTYKIENFVAFTTSMPFEGDVISRDDIREFLRGETTPIIRGVLAGPVMQKGVAACAANVGALSARALEEINARLSSKGLRVEGFSISRIDYDPSHLANRRGLTEIKVVNTLKREENAGRRDDISVDAMHVSDVDVPLINALNGKPEEQEKTLSCPKCGEKNDVGANFCKRCGENLIAIRHRSGD